ncbi:MAG: cobalamin-dependent protein [Nitriliruptoraceae bacterium]
MTLALAPGKSDEFFELALSGERTQAVQLALALLDEGVPLRVLLSDLIGVVQREIGSCWHRAEATSAEEHVVTGVSQATLEALSFHAYPHPPEGTVVVACAEGEWHSLPAQMFAVGLQAEGQGVLFLGGSTPAQDVASLLERRRPDALAVSCSLLESVFGVARLSDAAHSHGIPVLAGGRGLTAARASMLGADAWAADIPSVASLLRDWRQNPPKVETDPVELSLVAVELDARAEEFGAVAFEKLAQRFAPMATYNQHQRARTHEDLVSIVRFAAAARLVDDDEAFSNSPAGLKSYWLPAGSQLLLSPQA